MGEDPAFPAAGLAQWPHQWNVTSPPSAEVINKNLGLYIINRL